MKDGFKGPLCKVHPPECRLYSRRKVPTAHSHSLSSFFFKCLITNIILHFFFSFVLSHLLSSSNQHSSSFVLAKKQKKVKGLANVKGHAVTMCVLLSFIHPLIQLSCLWVWILKTLLLDRKMKPRQFPAVTGEPVERFSLPKQLHASSCLHFRFLEWGKCRCAGGATPLWDENDIKRQLDDENECKVD